MQARLLMGACQSFNLDGRNRARVVAESLARVIAAIRITSVRWRSYFPLKTQNLVLVDPAFVALRFESRDRRTLGVVFFPRGPAEWPARVDPDRVRWTLAIGDWRFGPSEVFKCYGDSQRCRGGLPGQTCAPGRKGIVCAECAELRSEDAMGGWKKEGGGKPHE